MTIPGRPAAATGSWRAGRRPLDAVVALVAVVAVGTVVTGCSSGPSSTPATTRPSGSSTSTTGPSPGTTSVSSTSSTTSGPPDMCPVADLTGSVVGSSGAAGTIEMTVALRSSSPAACVLGGYPGLLLLSAGGSALPTNVIRKGSYSFTAMAPQTVTLSSGQSVDFNLGYSDVPVGTETSCPTASSMEVTPPNATDHLVVLATLAPCGGGTVVVSPVFAAGGAESSTTAPSG
jgi:Protein of unknown function (DUF4232)